MTLNKEKLINGILYRYGKNGNLIEKKKFYSDGSLKSTFKYNENGNIIETKNNKL